MIKNILLYLVVLLFAFVFSVFYAEWFSWYLLLVILCIPAFSLVCSLPFMIVNAIRGFTVIIPNEVTVGERLSIGIGCRKGNSFFCPLMKISFKATNDFAHYKKRYKFIYGGFSESFAYKKTGTFTRSCGCLKIKAKYAKLYDMLGIFFIPVKINSYAEVLIMPREEKPSVMPDPDKIEIISYKPKPSGFAEEYELRGYQRGDSLKNIHWKISARYDDFVVKEPSTPIYKPLVLKPIIVGNKNDDITLGKLLYLSNYLLKNKSDFYCISPDNKICEIHSEEDIKDFLLQLYEKQTMKSVLIGVDNIVTYTITHNTEAVSG